MNKSPLAPHGAGRWVHCTGSVKLSLQFPPIPTEKQSEARLEGRAFHEVAEGILKGYKGDTEALMSRADIVDTLSKDNILITDEIYDAAVEYTNDVLKFCNRTGSLRALHIEDRIELDDITEGMYGYCDTWCYDTKSMKLVVWDAKFGHKHVEAFENWQLITYAFGILERLKVNGHTDQAINVSLRVAQPRVFHRDGCVSVWDVNAADLRAYFNSLIGAAYEAYSDDAKCVTSSECYYCPARYACDTFRNSTMLGVDYVGDVTGVSLSGHDLAIQLRILQRASKQIKALLSAYEEQAISQLWKGKQVPGYSTMSGKGRKRWKKDTPVDEIIMMGELLGIDPRKPVDLDTPTKLINLGIDESVINLYSETPSTGMKLVEMSNDKIRNIFKNIPKGS